MLGFPKRLLSLLNRRVALRHALFREIRCVAAIRAERAEEDAHAKRQGHGHFRVERYFMRYFMFDPLL